MYTKFQKVAWWVGDHDWDLIALGVVLGLILRATLYLY